ncbi:MULTISPECIES: carbohydrate ABC transporter permease [unclassified Streptomyces]|uniref:Carbohydrate ABC transporter permease n=1 Tax=Streptomyces evansiae TaxID=3075535 RepID=A0ABD5E6Z5_9ACTN|nr:MULTISPECIES: carbohydrate ABC transporter permease [unclassified Streptomyces]MYQ60140.1 ABC transporter permease subunit [Streptomyces sp. SID4926]MYX23162.1 ABC transporter permease subunit [Streptomyces sp. SID8380]ASY36254.1 ABC transporter permease [Streptomyces sp. CLI2509]MDT0410613.1 carbohydrate ABC transporter permease [Streptomyces sp. DSM 41979]MDT0416843.1 carbohydrate ABC transporter permease [Streptomyces sp. DSM 41982]
MSTQTSPALAVRGGGDRRPRPRGQVLSQVFLVCASVLWLLPILFALYVAIRPYSDTRKHGYVSLPHSLTLGNFSDAWTQANMGRFFWNSVLITVPAVVIVLVLASGAAFVLTRVNVKVNVALLIVFTAGNLLPQQVIITPLFRMYLKIPLPHFLADSGLMYNSAFGLIVINVAFQLGFCVFVLSNYMKSVPGEMYEAALVDGAGLWTRFWRLTVPLCRPALAALATLLTTWIYNDFFWAITLMSSGDKRPVTSALANLQGQFVTNQNLIAAGAMIAAIPTLVVYILLQKQFISGLSLGASKG